MNQIPSTSRLREALAISEQIEKLQSRLNAIIGGAPASSNAGAAPTRGGRRTMSASARARIAAAQRARWAKQKGEISTASPAPVASKAIASKSRGGSKRRGSITPEGRAKLAALMKARWAARKKGAAAPNAKS
jgi:hypothetical protein